ncbi:MAG: SPOR domain-containing protein, partial [Acidobacteriota bacterium]|nr:SPOR domain-containing protein [Acidobacteriota bacterium]
GSGATSAATAERSAAAATRLQPGWYVVAYTFNHQEQALKRASAIVRRYPFLHPEVIAPNGRTPYLIALGGAMSRNEAETIRERARRVGLPRDTFVRNYGS